MTGRLVAIVGPSGIGKTTIITVLVNREEGFERVPNITTRPRRWYEVDGRDYLFVSKEKMCALLTTDPTLGESMVQINGNLFTVSHCEIGHIINSGGIGLIELYIAKVPEFKEKYSDRFLSLYLLPPSLSVLAQRLKNYRLHNEAFVTKRMIQAERELNLACGKMKMCFDAFVELSPELPIAVYQVKQTIARLVLPKKVVKKKG
ncbi:MAG: hypothetical protein ACE5KE_00435 [Methanosarcinales archaeon]